MISLHDSNQNLTQFLSKDFMFQLQRRGLDDTSSQTSSASSIRSENSPLNADVFGSLMDSYEAKKKYVSMISTNRYH